MGSKHTKMLSNIAALLNNSEKARVRKTWHERRYLQRAKGTKVSR